MVITIMVILAGLLVLFALSSYFFAEKTINTNEQRPLKNLTNP